jgi:hypothetical protein
MVIDTFPSFRDETWFESRRGQCAHPLFHPHDLRTRVISSPPAVFFWKRAQILVAEIWAAFYSSPDERHPLFPSETIKDLTMFADYRVPQILHHLRILTYPPRLVRRLRAGRHLPAGGRDEVSIRAASIVAVERVREEIVRLGGEGVSSVLIDFYLWDLAKRIEGGEEKVEGVETAELIPAHRTRSIWY